MQGWNDGTIHELHSSAKSVDELAISSLNKNTALIIPLETIEALNKEGWAIKPGMLGENLTTKGIPENQMVHSVTWRIGYIRGILQSKRYIEDLNSIEELKKYANNWEKFKEAIRYRLGTFIYFRDSGTIKKGDKIKVHPPLQ